MRSSFYAQGKTALVTCDPFMIFLTPAQIKSGAAAAFKGIDPKQLSALSAAGKDPKAAAAALPPHLKAMAEKMKVCFLNFHPELTCSHWQQLQNQQVNKYITAEDINLQFTVIKMMNKICSHINAVFIPLRFATNIH
jgi:hypothetical protein